jgi:cyclomaltodextrinase / maltogenic alpha-amylase / neopullulanase
MGSKVVAAIAVALVFAAPANAAVRLFHDTFSAQYRSPFGAVPAGSKVTLRLRVTGAKPTSVALHVGKAFHAMRRRGTMWTSVLTTPSTPQIVNYDFRVRFGRRTLWYGDNGSADVLMGGTGVTSSLEGVPFAITAYAPSFTTPAWAQGAVVYEIFVDRFRNGDPSNDYCRAGSPARCPTFYGNIPARLHPSWNEAVDENPPDIHNRDFFGGDLEGIQQELPYLKSLGVDAIWTTPIFMARSNHRYDTDNYTQVDPSLGGNSAFASLASAMKAGGMHWILDGVFNHASSDSLYFDRYHRYSTDGACESTSSPWRSWFQFSSQHVPCDQNDYVQWNGIDTLPVFNHDNQEVKDFFFKAPDGIAERWLAAGASGWRLDAADQIDHAWWREFRTAVKAAYPDAPLIAEDTGGPADATDFLLGNELDGVMNYRFRDDANAFVTGGSGAQLAHALLAMAQEYPTQALAVSFDLIDSHDTQRALATYGGDTAEAKQRLELAALLQYTWVGAPMTLYGDEVAINAPGNDPFNRAPYPWPDASGDVSLYGPPDLGVLHVYMQLGQIRSQLPALRQGSFTSLYASSNVYAFLRSGGAAKPVVVALNNSASIATAQIPVKGVTASTWTDALSGKTFSGGGRLNVTIPPRGGLILVGS